jgi:hypothetical protein
MDYFLAKAPPDPASGLILDTPLPQGISRTGREGDLTGAGPQVLQHQGPQVAVRISRGQLHSDAAAGFPDAGPDLQKLETQGVDLRRGQFRVLEVMSQQRKQAIGGGAQEQAELVGQEAVATQAVGPELQLEPFDAVFCVAPQHIEVVIDKPGIATQVGDHEARIGAEAVILHFGDDPAGPGPGLRLIAEGGKEPRFFPRLLLRALRSFQEGGGLFQDPAVSDEADDLADILPLQIAVERGNGKAGIGPEEDECPGISLLQLLDQPLEQCQRPVRGVGVAGAQNRGQGKAGASVEDEERMIHRFFVIAMEEGYPA